MRFVLIDALLELEPGSHAVARTSFSRDDDLFADHFPGRPIVPGVLLTEAMSQTGGWLLAATLQFTGWPLLVLIERAKFRRLVSPGDEIELRARLRSTQGENYAIDVEARVGANLVATARLLFHAVDWSLDPAHERLER